MPTYPLILPDSVKINKITRITSPINSCFMENYEAPVPIDLSIGSMNMYVVYGENLNKIISVNWYPAIQTHIIFKMVPWTNYPFAANEATFGICILDQQTYDYQRGGTITFRLATGYTGSVPAATFSTYPWTFNPVQSPLQGWDTGAQDNGGGAY